MDAAAPATARNDDLKVSQVVEPTAASETVPQRDAAPAAGDVAHHTDADPGVGTHHADPAPAVPVRPIEDCPATTEVKVGRLGFTSGEAVLTAVAHALCEKKQDEQEEEDSIMDEGEAPPVGFLESLVMDLERQETEVCDCFDSHSFPALNMLAYAIPYEPRCAVCGRLFSGSVCIAAACPTLYCSELI